jgi:hypothetical protein
MNQIRRNDLGFTEQCTAQCGEEARLTYRGQPWCGDQDCCREIREMLYRNYAQRHGGSRHASAGMHIPALAEGAESC